MEKEELSKARDESLVRTKNAEEHAAKELNKLRDYRLQNVRCCLLFIFSRQNRRSSVPVLQRARSARSLY